MKKKPFVLSVIVAILATVVVSCEKDIDYGYSITMTTEASDVTFQVDAKLYNKIEVNWGDGNIENYTSKFYTIDLKHEYLDTSPKTITITGLVTCLSCSDNGLTKLDVSNNNALIMLDCIGTPQLTSLDVSKNIALESISCSNNQFTTAELNTLFGTLHRNNVPTKLIQIGGNPGTATCDRSIAESKGWHIFDN